MVGEAGREEAREEDVGDEGEKCNRVLLGARRAGELCWDRREEKKIKAYVFRHSSARWQRQIP